MFFPFFVSRICFYFLLFQTMTRGRYRKLASYLHLADNAILIPGNKTAKVDPLYEKLNENLVQFGVWHESLSIDESMVPYFGKNSIKQFVRGKPIRFGYKLWALCSYDGYPYHVDIYCGKSAVADGPLGERVVMKMVDVVKCNSALNRHHLFFDNFFTSHRLLTNLSDKKVCATGTIRENRTNGASSVLMSKVVMKKKERGYFDFVCDGKVYVAKWNDNATVCVASNCLTHEPTHVVRRYVKRNPNQAVTQPHLIHRYNQGMGGVDIMDRLLSTYRPMLRGKKWWWPLFLNVINLTVVAAWRVYNNLHGGELDHLGFRRQVTICLVKITRPLVDYGRPATLPDDVRYGGIGHTLQHVSEGRCRVCGKNTKKACSKCDARLHSDRGKTCFNSYHTRP